MLADVKVPRHASILVREVEQERPCEEAGLSRALCWFRSSETVSQVRLELGDASAPQGVDVPGLELGASALGDGGTSGLELVEDASGTRLAWRPAAGAPWRYLFVLGDEVIDLHGGWMNAPFAYRDATPDAWRQSAEDLPMGAGPVDWRAVPTLADLGETMALHAPDAVLPRLLALIRKERGEVGLGQALARTLFRSGDTTWAQAFASLGPEGRAAYTARVREALLARPPVSPLAELLSSRPDLAPEDLDDLLRAGRPASDSERGADVPVGP